MNALFSSALGVARPVFDFVLAHKIASVAIGIALVFGGSIALNTLGGGQNGEDVESLRAVDIRSVYSLSSESGSVPAFGTVRSESEASVRAEASGEITALYYTLGDRVSAGAPVAEIKNASERAALRQAEAALAKVQGSARPEQIAILDANVLSAEASLNAALSSARNALASGFQAIDDAIRVKTDGMFSNPATNPTFLVSTSDSQLVLSLQNTRPQMGNVLQRYEASLSATIGGDAAVLTNALLTAEADLALVRSYLDTLADALGKAIPGQTITATTIATYQSNTSTARSSVTSALGTLVSARDTLAARVSALEVARQNQEQGVVGGQREDVESAQAGVAAARAALERTILRSPISGTLNALPITRGNFISAGSVAFTVANNNALEIIAYVSESDARSVVAGARVLIDGVPRGAVTRISPAADPQTRRIEVRVGVNEDAGLINGQGVSLSIEREEGPDENAPLSVPLTAIKIEPNRTVVFSVNEEGALEAHEVVLGDVRGDRVVVEGILADLFIVVDARGLREGQKVSVRE